MLTAALVLILVPSVAFLCIHGFTRPWWKSWESRAMMTSATGWALVSAGFLVNNHADVPDWAWVAVAGVGAASQWLKLWILVQSRRAE
jgi:hypothetical protein